MSERRPEVVQTVIDQQMEALHQLHKSARKVVRFQMLMLSILLTGLSIGAKTTVMGLGSFFPPDNVWDFLVLAPLATGIVFWGSVLFLTPNVYSGIHYVELTGNSSSTVSDLSETIEQAQQDVQSLYQLFGAGVLALLTWVALHIAFYHPG